MMGEVVKKLFGLKVAAIVAGCKFEFSKAMPGSIFRVCATIYNPTNPGPYNDDTWDVKIGAVVIARTAILSVNLKRA